MAAQLEDGVANGGVVDRALGEAVIGEQQVRGDGLGEGRGVGPLEVDVDLGDDGAAQVKCGLVEAERWHFAGGAPRQLDADVMREPLERSEHAAGRP